MSEPRPSLVAGVVVALVAFAVYLVFAPPRARGQAPPQPATSTSVPPPGPPCTHETCGERPGWLTCVHAPGAGYCAQFRVVYEHHCLCDAWGPAPEGDRP